MNTLVSVILITYQHANFIKQCLDSILMQQTNFNFEIIIGEDESTDGTREICKQYADKYPDKIRLFLRSRKDVIFINGKPSGRFNFLECLKVVKSKYVALCEGDDYWTDPLKLQKQVDFMEANNHIAGCFHDVTNVDENSQMIKEKYHESKKTIYDQQDCLTWGGAYATCSLVFRSIVLKNMPKWYLKAASDYAMDLLITEFGNIAYIEQNMGAYRIHKTGLWQGTKTHKNLEVAVLRYRMCLTNPKFKREYGSFFYKAIYERSYTLALHYLKEKKWFKRMKYTTYCFRYIEPKKISSFKFLGIQLLFPSYLKVRKLISKNSSK